MSLSDAPSTTKPKKKTRGWLHEIISTVVYPLVAVLAVYSFIYQPFRIPSSSMVDTLLVGDFVWVQKFSYGYSKHSIPFSPNLFKGRIFGSEPERGDVIVFKLPSDNSTDYIKRLVGLPGDRIQVRQGVLSINGTPVKMENLGPVDVPVEGSRGSTMRVTKYRETLPNGVSHFILKSTESGVANNTIEYVVPPGHYFMMGDNRDNSTDSRFAPSGTPGDFIVSSGGVGFVPFENLEGRADLIFPSWDGNVGAWYEFWTWPMAVRWDRLFHPIR